MSWTENHQPTTTPRTVREPFYGLMRASLSTLLCSCPNQLFEGVGVSNSVGLHDSNAALCIMALAVCLLYITKTLECFTVAVWCSETASYEPCGTQFSFQAAPSFELSPGYSGSYVYQFTIFELDTSIFGRVHFLSLYSAENDIHLQFCCIIDLNWSTIKDIRHAFDGSSLS